MRRLATPLLFAALVVSVSAGILTDPSQLGDRQYDFVVIGGACSFE